MPTSLAILGGGPKAVAIASKANVLRRLGILDVDVTIFDENDIASHWDGEHGFTDGDHRLGTPPDKDVGFPYASIFGKEVDAELFRYSWASYLVAEDKFAGYVDRGKPHPSHRVWAKYLRWVLQQIKFNPIIATVTAFDTPPPGSGVLLGYRVDAKQEQLKFDGLVLTGPGRPTRIAGSNHGWTEHIIDGRQFWQRIPMFRHMSGQGKKVAIIGGGETAASIAVCLIKECPGLSIQIVNRHGTLYTRGESYHENELYTDPSRWAQLDEIDREDFIHRTDRGVFSVESKKTIDHADNIQIITGNVHNISQKGKVVLLHVRRGRDQTVQYSYDSVIVATGFDPFSDLELLPDHKRTRFAKKADGSKTDLYKEVRHRIDYHLRLPVPFDAPDVQPVHVPMLSSLSQGPGFPNLSCLGALSDRVLSAYLDETRKRQFIKADKGT